MRQQDFDVMDLGLREFRMRGDKSSAAQMSSLIKINKALDSKMTQGQKASYSKIGKKLVGRMNDASERWGSTPSSHGALWSAYAKAEVQKLLLRGSTQKKAMDRAIEILQRHDNDFWKGIDRMPPTASKNYAIRSSRATDEERYARSGGRGSNSRGMSGLGLRNGTAPAKAATAAKSGSAIPAISLNGSKSNPNDAKSRRSGDAAAYLKA